MYQIANQATLTEAARHLTAADPLLAPVIARAGLCEFSPSTTYYQHLVNSIIGQQLSVKAAATIKQRFAALSDSGFPSPEELLTKDIEELRAVGLSKQKASYIRDLAEHVLDGRIHFDHLDTLSNEDIIKELTAVKGIGEWTVHMFLMFCMGRLDVLAHGDLGVRNAVKNIYGLENASSPAEIQKLAKANHWHPYESVACWYLWRSLDNAPL